MSTIYKRCGWRDEQTIKQHEFEAGYLHEAAAQSQNPTERDANTEGAVVSKEHTHGQTAASETTLWADGSPTTRDRYKPYERLLDGRTRRKKYTTLWRFNSGHDSWRVSRKSREQCHKADENTAYKRRFTEAVCGSLELSSVATEWATELASRNAPPQLNFVGGLPVWVLTCSLIAANEHGDVLRMNRGALTDLRELHDVTVENLAKTTNLADTTEEQ